MPRGVPQLCPLLYSIYTNDLPLQVKHWQILMYANGVQLYMGCNASDARSCIPYKWHKYKSQQINGITD